MSALALALKAAFAVTEVFAAFVATEVFEAASEVIEDSVVVLEVVSAAGVVTERV